MLDFLRSTGKASDRKLRLFAVACCRRLEAELPDQRSWDAVHVAEWYADGNGSEQDMVAARADAEASFREDRAAYPAVQATAPDPWEAATGVVEAVGYLGWEYYEEGREREQGQTRLLRDIFGPLAFRPVPVDSSLLKWKDSTVAKLAQAIYEERRFADLPILADALEDAGCDNEEMLHHCRLAEEHVRGCWILDLLLQKS